MKKDWILFVDIVLIIIIGLTTLYSTVIGEETILQGGVFTRQLLFVLVGISIYFVVTYFNYSYTGHPQVIIPILGLSTLTLLLLLIFGIEINNSKRWILIGNYEFQVSEFSKIALILAISWVLSLRHKYNIWILGGIAILTVCITSLLIFLEPDASTSIITFVVGIVIVFSVLPNQIRNFLVLSLLTLAAVFTGHSIFSISTATWVILGMIIITGIALFFVEKKFKILALIVLLTGAGLGYGIRLSWQHVLPKILKEYQMERIESYLNPEADPENKNFQVQQAKVAIGSGKIFGKGLGHGTQSKLKFIPEYQTDFIFAAYAEEFGLVGSIVLLFLYGLAVFRIFLNSSKAGNIYGALICIGFGVKFLLEIFINLGTNLGVTPATGIPLPLMSRGGSTFLATMIGLGFVQSVYRNRNLVDSVETVS